MFSSSPNSLYFLFGELVNSSRWDARLITVGVNVMPREKVAKERAHLLRGDQRVGSDNHVLPVLPPDRVWRRRKGSGLTGERERLRETHKCRLYTAACNWAQKQKPKESSVRTTHTGKLPSEETFYVNTLQGHSTPKNYWTIITAVGFDRKTIRFGALHNEIESNLPKDLRFSAYIITGGFHQ